ncbi:MAG: GNAT family N-acetyltransferase [Candidatus Dojkabacteria bacterium]|nr:GNAT family N-acetyltransferase [Candidatus Dojkabacteria bacterium]
MKIKYRDYTESDKNEILRLFLLFGNFFKDIDDLKRIVVRDNYSEVIFKEMIQKVKGNEGFIFVVEDVEKKKLAGFIQGSISYITKDNSVESVEAKKGRIDELFVENDYRGLGIGKDLMAMAEDLFKDKNCDVINLEVFAPNSNALKFYESLGFSTRNYDLIKVIK